MANANDSSTAGGTYFDAYQAALSHEPKRWAWHAYKDGEETYAKSTASAPDYAGYWRRTKGFLRATAGRPIWLTEQGVVRFRSGDALPASNNAVANAIMRLYVDDERALTELDSRINMFLYYQWRGDPVGRPNRFDSGLVSSETGRTRDVYCIYRRKTNPSQPAC